MTEKELEKIIKRLLYMSFAISKKDIETYFYYLGDEIPYKIEIVFHKEYMYFEREYFDKFTFGIENHLKGFIVTNWWIRENEVTIELFNKRG